MKLGLKPGTIPILLELSYPATYQAQSATFLLSFLQFNYHETKLAGCTLGPTCWSATSRVQKATNCNRQGKNCSSAAAKQGAITGPFGY